MLREEASKDLFMNCVGLYLLQKRGLIATQSAWLEEVRGILKKLLILKARALHKRHLGLECSDDFPGYLYYTHQNIRVFFPWLIVDDLPSPDVLDFLIRLAMRIKASTMSFTCLSGSALYFNSLRSISDLDFLEYELNPDLDRRNIEAKGDIALVKQRDGYVEYVTDTPFYGTVEVTNRLVTLDTTKTGVAAAEQSSAYQEAPLTATPRELYDPVALGRYICFLAGQTLMYHSKESAKIAKRLLPLSRIIEDQKIADSILNAFDSEAVQAALQVKQKIDLIRKIGRRTEEPLKRFTALAQNEVNSIRNVSDGPLSLTEQEGELVGSLTAAMRHIAMVNFEKLKALSVA